jgi:hypothetical protein
MAGSGWPIAQCPRSSLSANRQPPSAAMGLLKHLLFWPVTGPTFLARFSLETVQDTVRTELTDDQSVKEELMALQMELELGEIDDDQYVAREAALMQRLREVREWREQFGMGTSGGPVRVARDAPAQDEVPNVAENVVAAPRGTDDREEQRRPGGLASPEGASAEVEWGSEGGG